MYWVALTMCRAGVYLWSAHTSQVTKLCDLCAPYDTDDVHVTSVKWINHVRLVLPFLLVPLHQLLPCMVCWAARNG